MIPEFPKFKSLELTDKADIESFTSKFPPYSDFNFVSMWSWDINGQMQVSQLHDNLVIRFTDYLTGEHFFSFLGDTEINQTAQALFDFSKKENVQPQLKLIPENSIKGLDSSRFLIQEDDNHFDYVYTLSELKSLKGSKFESKRGVIHRFLAKHKEVNSMVIDASDPKIRKDILEINNSWIEHKKLKDPFFDIKNELIAIDKFLNTDHPFKYCCVGVFADKVLVGYSINEIVSKEYSIGHFIKCNHDGCFEYLMQQTAHHLFELGVTYFNFEQDLGVPGLRHSKKSYRPSTYLKKYIISHNISS